MAALPRVSGLGLDRDALHTCSRAGTVNRASATEPAEAARTGQALLQWAVSKQVHAGYSGRN